MCAYCLYTGLLALQVFFSFLCDKVVSLTAFVCDRLSFGSGEGCHDEAVITRDRHRFHVNACLQALQRFLLKPGQVFTQESEHSSLLIGV